MINCAPMLYLVELRMVCVLSIIKFHFITTIQQWEIVRSITFDMEEIMVSLHTTVESIEVATEIFPPKEY